MDSLTSDAIRLAPESFVFTCAMDGNKTEHYLPEVNQPAYGTTLAITAVTTNTFTINVGASGPDVQFTPTGAIRSSNRSDGSYHWISHLECWRRCCS